MFYKAEVYPQAEAPPISRDTIEMPIAALMSIDASQFLQFFHKKIERNKLLL